MTNLSWRKCGKDSRWCSLETLNLDSITANLGVYVIWHVGNPSRTVRVGQGQITNRLSTHRNDAEILAHKHGGLRVTWAEAPADELDGIEVYLADLLNPLVGDAFPDAVPIQVNSPFAA